MNSKPMLKGADESFNRELQEGPAEINWFPITSKNGRKGSKKSQNSSASVFEEKNNGEAAQQEIEIASTNISLKKPQFKCDSMSMVAPINTLSKPINPPKDKNDVEALEKYNSRKNTKLKERVWKSVDGKQELIVMPTALGQPTMNDKKIIIYIISCLIQMKNEGLPISRKVRFRAYDYLIATHGSVGREEYERLEQGLDRYVTTVIKTNIKSNGVEITSVFSLIDSYRISKVDSYRLSEFYRRCEYVEVTISQWLFNAVDGFDVITISEDYFDLKPFEKRIYEIARKQCGNQADFKIGINNLLEKTGSEACIKEFNRMLRAIIAKESLPDYKLQIQNKDAIIYQKDVKKYAEAIACRNAKKAAKK